MYRAPKLSRSEKDSDMTTAASRQVTAVLRGLLTTDTTRSRSSRSPVLPIFGSLVAGAVLVAGLAEHVNVSAAVGAFLVGIAISGPAAENAAGSAISLAILKPMRKMSAASADKKCVEPFWELATDYDSCAGIAQLQ